MTARRPSVVAFDVIETLFSLQPVADALTPVDIGLDLFFARLLRDGFALTAAGDHRPFKEVARAALSALAPKATDDARAAVLDAFTRLPARPDAEPALRTLTEQGITVVTLTNGGADATLTLLQGAGLDGYVERVVSVDDASAWKPAPAPYRHLAQILNVPIERIALVAVHSWDIHGAHAAGMVTGWCSRLEGSLSEIFSAADVAGADLVAVANALLAFAD